MFKRNFEIEQHRYLALFLTIFYCKPWILCPLPFEATVNDLGFFHQLRSVQGKSNLPPFYDGFITAALNCLKAHLWYLSKEMAFLSFFFKAVDCQRKRPMQKGNVAIQTEIQSCSWKFKQNGDTRAQKMYKNKKPILTKFHSDSRKTGNSTNFFGNTSFAMAKSNSNHNFIKKALSKMQVVNDSAERSILLAKIHHNKLTTNPNERSHLY